MERGLRVRFIGESIQRNEGEGFFGGGGGRGGQLDVDGVFAEEVVLEGLFVDEVLLGAEEVGGEEDVGAEGGEEGVELGGGGGCEGGEGA